MLRRMYCIYDTCSGVHDLPVPAHNDDHIVRMVRQALQEDNHPIAKSPKDFCVRFIGVFDDSSGRFEPAEPIVTIVTAIELLPEKQEED